MNITQTHFVYLFILSIYIPCTVAPVTLCKTALIFDRDRKEMSGKKKIVALPFQKKKRSCLRRVTLLYGIDYISKCTLLFAMYSIHFRLEFLWSK